MRWTGPLLVALVAAVVAAIVAIDLEAPSTATRRAEPMVAGPATGGVWYCAAAATGEGHETTLSAAAPTSSSDPAEVEVATLEDGERQVIATNPVFPGSARVTSPTPEDEGGTLGAAVRWWDNPVVVSRAWDRESAESVSGTISGPCASAPSSTWYVPGISTAEGGTARLHLLNPFTVDASVTVTFTTPTSREEPILLQNVSVPAQSVEVVELNEFVPRQADLGVTVRTRSGRVVVEGVQELDAAIGGVEARALAPATPTLSETWVLPWSLGDPVAEADDTEEPDGVEPAPPAEGEEPTSEGDTPVVSTSSPGNGTASWLWVSNPGEDDAAVTLTLHTSEGPVVPDVGELMVEGGRVLRIDLRGLLPPGVATAGATLRSENGVPVAASVSTLMEPEVGDPDETGYTSQRGWPRGAEQWVVPGEAPGDRQQVLHLVNAGGDDAVVDVALWNGTRLHEPSALQDVPVPAGHLVELDVTEVVAGAEQFVAYVTASEGEVVAGRHSVATEGGPDGWIAHVGVPARLWAGGETVPAVGHDPILIEQLGTAGGLQDGSSDGDGAPSPGTPTP